MVKFSVSLEPTRLPVLSRSQFSWPYIDYMKAHTLEILECKAPESSNNHSKEEHFIVGKHVKGKGLGNDTPWKLTQTKAANGQTARATVTSENGRD